MILEHLSNYPEKNKAKPLPHVIHQYKIQNG